MKITKTIITVAALFFLAACGGVTKVGNPTGTASLTTLADLPELDASRYDTSHKNFSNPAALTTRKVASSTGNFSRDGCDAKQYKQDTIELSLFAEAFLCLYKMAEEHYPTEFTIPTEDFNYYTITDNFETLTGRIGHFPDGFGEINEAVLVLDECNADGRSAEMRVTASTVSEDLTGSGYLIRFLETGYVGDEENSEEKLGFTIDTRNTLWEIAVDFRNIRRANGAATYGTLGLALDTDEDYNIFTTATYDEDVEGIYEITSNTVFGPWEEIEGFEIGGSSKVNVIQSADPESEVMGDIQGFVFNDSETLPAIQLDATEISEFPFYEELDALEDPATSVTEPSFAFRDEWDCSLPEGREAVNIDLTPDDIAADLEACESVDEEEDEELDCAALEDENE